MDREWVDRWLEELHRRGDEAGPRPWRLFDPTPDFYQRLQSGEDSDLQWGAEAVGRHLQLGALPGVAYEWGLRLKPQVAGRIRFGAGPRSNIEIPLLYVGKPFALGAILAHEMAHELLGPEAGMAGVNLDEYELLTDLASIAFGLGKLTLNGTTLEMAPLTGEVQIIGYLSPLLKAHAYCRVNQRHQISDVRATDNLTPDSLRLLQTVAPGQAGAGGPESVPSGVPAGAHHRQQHEHGWARWLRRHLERRQ